MVLTRNQTKIKLKPSKIMAVIIIQRNFRNYLGKRYNVKNSEDYDIITQLPVKLIPKKKMLVIKHRGYDGSELIKWVNTFNIDRKPYHPLFRTEYNQTEIKRIINFGINYIKSLEGLNKTEFSIIIKDLITKEILRNY